MPAVAIYETILTVPRPASASFAFVSDFSNAVHWDPRTYATEKVTEGPVGVGTRFMLTGGMMKEAWVRRFRIPKRLAGMALPYDVVEFDSPNGFVLEGETRVFRYRDEIDFSEEGDVTKVRYWAKLEFKGPLRILDLLLRPMFRRIGDDATRDLPEVVSRLG